MPRVPPQTAVGPQWWDSRHRPTLSTAGRQRLPEMENARAQRAYLLMIRCGTFAAFAAQITTLAVTRGKANWAPLWRRGFGWRFWEGMGSSSAWLAFACVILCAIFLVQCKLEGDKVPVGVGRLLVLNVVTIGLLCLVPAISAV